MRYGVSVTDGCIGIKETEELLLSTQDLIQTRGKFKTVT